MKKHQLSMLLLCLCVAACGASAHFANVFFAFLFCNLACLFRMWVHEDWPRNPPPSHVLETEARAVKAVAYRPLSPGERQAMSDAPNR